MPWMAAMPAKFRQRNSLRDFVAREAASTGQQKRWCASCGEHVFDQDRTRSKFCQRCRGARRMETPNA